MQDPANTSYGELCNNSLRLVKLNAKIVNSWKSLTIFAKSSISRYLLLQSSPSEVFAGSCIRIRNYQTKFVKLLFKDVLVTDPWYSFLCGKSWLYESVVSSIWKDTSYIPQSFIDLIATETFFVFFFAKKKESVSGYRTLESSSYQLISWDCFSPRIFM